MSEARVLTEQMIDEKLVAVRPQEIKYIDPMKLAFWSLETAALMANDTISEKTISRAIRDGELTAYKAGKCLAVVPSDFLTWLKRSRV